MQFGSEGRARARSCWTPLLHLLPDARAPADVREHVSQTDAALCEQRVLVGRVAPDANPSQLTEVAEVTDVTEVTGCRSTRLRTTIY